MKFGEKLKEIREIKKMSLNKLAKEAEISPSYISKLENNPNKTPSDEMLFKITHGLCAPIGEDTDHTMTSGDILEEFYSTDNYDLDEKEISVKLFEFLEFTKEVLTKATHDIINMEQIIYENRLKINKNTLKSEITDYPYFDLKWLLTQNKFKVYYGRQYLIKNITNLNSKERLDYNELGRQDLNTIFAIVEAYISSNYKKLKESDVSFESLFNDYLLESISTTAKSTGDEELLKVLKEEFNYLK